MVKLNSEHCVWPDEGTGALIAVGCTSTVRHAGEEKNKKVSQLRRFFKWLPYPNTGRGHAHIIGSWRGGERAQSTVVNTHSSPGSQWRSLVYGMRGSMQAGFTSLVMIVHNRQRRESKKKKKKRKKQIKNERSNEKRWPVPRKYSAGLSLRWRSTAKVNQ